MEVILTNNYGYSWISENGIHFKGYLALNNGEILRGKDAIKEFLVRLSQNVSLKELFTGIDGCFAVIVNVENYKFAATDISRSMPLFFSEDGSIVSDSADTIRERLGVAIDEVDIDIFPQYLATGYLFGNETAYRQVKQLDLGQCVDFSLQKPLLINYYYHLTSVVNYDKDEIISKLTETAVKVFERIKKVINGRPVVLSLSGGYDSRFVACMLKRVGVEDVSCYTYGKSNSFEVEQSKRNAEALGYRWVFVEHTDESVKGCIDELGQKYINTFLTHDYYAYLQNFPAVRFLHNKGWIKPNSVFITGLCGDMPTGNYLISPQNDFEYSVHTAAERLYCLVLDRYRLDDEYKEKLINKLENQILSLPNAVVDYQSWISAIDAIYTGTCHSHAFLNMNRVHEFFGYEWLLPYWDKELLSLWYSTPASMRIKQELYADWLMDVICKPYGLNQRKKVVVYSKNKLKKRIQYLGGTILSFICLNLGIPFRRRFDFNNWAPLELELFKKLPDKRLIDYRKAGFTNLLVNYIFQNRYGVDNARKAKKHMTIPK